MKALKILLVLLVLNTCCFGSEEKPAEAQPPIVKTQPSFWSYFKYIDPYYYWQKYQLQRLEAQIETTKQKMIEKFNQDITGLQSDIDILQKITNADEFDQNKAKLKTNLALKLKDLSIKEFLEQKKQVIEALQKDIVVTEKLKEQALVDQEIEALQKKKAELQQQIESYE